MWSGGVPSACWSSAHWHMSMRYREGWSGDSISISCSLCTSWVCLETGVALLLVAGGGVRGMWPARGGSEGCGQQGVGQRGVASRSGSEGCGQQGWVEGVWPARGRVKRCGSEEKDQMRTYNVTEGKCAFSSQGHNRPRPSVCMSVCVSVTMQCALTCLPGSQGGVCWRVVSLGLAVGCGGPVRHGPTDYWREGHISCIHSQRGRSCT